MASYRNPRYMMAHLYRDNVNGTPIVGPEDPDFPKSRLIDGANGALWRSGNAAADAELVFELLVNTEEAYRPELIRIIIPSSKTLYDATQRLLVETGSTASTGPWDDVYLLDGTLADLYAPPDVFDFELALNTFQFEFWRFLFYQQITAAGEQEAGEIYASDIVETNTGIVQTWEDVDEPNVNVATTLGGNVYSIVRGQPRRVWTMEYRNVDEDDVLALDQVRRLAGVQQNAFWFDPPDSANAEEETFQFIATPPEGTWNTLSSGTNVQFLSDDAGSNPTNNGDYMRVVNAITSPNLLRQTINLNEPVDFRFKFFRCDVNVAIPGWAEALDAITITLATEADGSGGSSEFSLSKCFVEQAADDVWRRVYIDPRNSPSIGVSEQHMRFDTVRSITFNLDTQVQFHLADFANFRLVNPAKRPKYVELLNYRKTQASDNPGARIKYDVDVQVREVLT